MGCGKTKTLVLRLEGSTKEKKGGFSDISQVKQWACKEFPPLRYRSFVLFSHSKPIKQKEDYSTLLQESKKRLELDIQIETQESTLPDISHKVVKICGSSVEATGLMLSPIYLLTSSVVFQSEKTLESFTVLTCENNEHSLKESGLFYKLGDHLIVIELSSPMSFESDLECCFSIKQNEQVCVLHYTRQRPILQEFRENIKRIDKGVFPLSKLRTGSDGAPLLNSYGELIGIYSLTLEAGISLSQVYSFLENLEELRHLVKTDWFGPSVIENASLKFLKGKNEKKANVNIEGYPRFAISHGNFILITGSDYSKNWNKAWIFEGNEVKPIQDMIFPHKYYCSVAFEGDIYVISGKYSKGMESWNGNEWVKRCKLPERTAFAAASASEEAIYVCGGEQKSAYSDKILCYSLGNWNLLDLRLPSYLASHISFFCHERLVVFGGFTMDDRGKYGYNYLGFCLDFKDREIEEFSQEESLAFAGASLVQSDEKLLAYTCSGQLIEYNLKDKQVITY